MQLSMSRYLAAFLAVSVSGFFLGVATTPLRALDIDPSRDHVPDNRNDSTSNSRFSIFSGDANRIQKANTIDFADFETSLALTPDTASLAATHNDASYANNVRMTLTIKNLGKRKKTYSLSFANAQRYEIKVKNPTGQLVYQWSLDKKFEEAVGVVMINPTDRIAYTETVSFDSLYAPLEAGSYTVEFSLANYPEIAGKATFKVSP